MKQRVSMERTGRGARRLLVSLLLVLAMAASLLPGLAMKAYAAGTTGTAVTSLSDGDYLIVDSQSGTYYAMTGEQGGSSGSGYYLNATSVSYSDGTATVSDSTGSAVWTYSSSNGSLQNKATGKYLAMPTSQYSSMLSDSPVSLTSYTISGTEMTVYNPYGNGGYYLNMGKYSAGFKTNYSKYINSNYLSSGDGVYFCKVDSSSSGGGETPVDPDEPDNPGGGGGDNPGGGESEEPADPAHVKSITNDGQVADEYTISLNVKGQSKTTTSTTTGETTTSPYDILLVLDNTTSMTRTYGSTTRLAAMKSAAKTFVSGLPASDSSKIAMISFVVGNYESPTTTNVNWTALNSGKSSVTSAINGLTAPDATYGYDTCFTQPLERASSMMSSVSSDSNKKFVVFFTDGAAAETASQIQLLASAVTADARFSIGITTNYGDGDKAQAVASSSSYYYDVTNGGDMSSAFNSTLQTITSQTTVSKAPMTGVTIKDTLSEYVELSQPDAQNSGVTLEASLADSKVSIGSVEVSGKEVAVTLSGNLTDDTIYTVNIPVKPSEQAHTEANTAETSPSQFPSNTSASLTYQYGTEAAKTINYTETPKIAVAKQYTLTYDDNVEAEEIVVPEEQTADAEGKVTISSTTPTRDGYTFLGWSTQNGATEANEAYAAGTEVTLTENTTLYAVWKINEFTVTFDANGHGTAPDAQKVEYNGKATAPDPTPTADGYTFGGWYTEADCTNEYSFDTSVTADTTVYAKWTPEEYTITYILDGGALADGQTNPSTYTVESEDITLINPTKVGYNFTGWTGTELDTATDSVTIAKGSTGDRTYTATWEAADVTYTVKHCQQNLDGNGYTTVDTETLTGKAGSDTAAVAKEYAGFAAKPFEQQMIMTDGSTVVKIYYTRNSHKVTYSVTGEAPSGSTTPTGGDFKYGAPVTVADTLTSSETTKEGLQGTWTFSGWTTSDAAVADNAFTMPDNDVTLTGTWTFTEAGKYNVSYVVNGEKPSDYVEPNGPKNQYAGTKLPMPEDLTTNETSKDGVPGTWAFSGWKITDPVDLAVTDNQYTMPASNVTITGSWTFTADTYTVTWMDESGNILEQDENVAYNAKPEYNGDAPTKDSVSNDQETITYTFKGWTPELSAVTADVTYTAQFDETHEAKKYTIRFVNEDGTELQSTQVAYGEMPSYTGSTPTKEEDATNTYTFAGWTPEITAVTGDATYTSTFTTTAKPVNYTVTFDSAGGSAVDQQTVAKGASATKPADPTRDGYTFKGWTLGDADYDFSTPVTGDITLVAQWEENQPETKPGYTVDTKEKGHTYEIYQIFTGNYTDKDGKAILTDIVWGENGKGTDANPAVVGQPVPESIINALKALTGGEVEHSDKEKLAEIEKYVSMTSTANYPKTIKSEDGQQVKITDLPAGYYLIKDQDGSQTGKDDSYTLYITQIVKDYTIKPKSVKPTVDKQVATDESNWGETADYAINKSFQFKLTAALPASTHYADYTAYKLVFTDTMSAGVTFDGIASVSVGNTAVPETGYTVSGVSQGEAGKTWTLTIDNVKSVQSDLSAGANVTVIYNAHLNENAVAYKASADSVEANKNTVSLQYSNNPNTDHGTDMGQTTSDTVYTFTYEVDNTKRKNSEDGDPLPDAGFRLYDSSNHEVALTYNQTKSAYIPAAAGTTGVEMKSAADGKFNIVGLDAGTYTLKETKTPAGYNKCADTTITITATHSENGDASTANLTLTGNTDNTIVNNSGTALPSTGGMGTRIFYILGTILVLGAGIVLVSRRRTKAE